MSPLTYRNKNGPVPAATTGTPPVKHLKHSSHTSDDRTRRCALPVMSFRLIPNGFAPLQVRLLPVHQTNLLSLPANPLLGFLLSGVLVEFCFLETKYHFKCLKGMLPGHKHTVKHTGATCPHFWSRVFVTLCLSKFGPIHKHIVKHIGQTYRGRNWCPVPVQVQTNTHMIS
jgi:hypothetical protein